MSSLIAISLLIRFRDRHRFDRQSKLFESFSFSFPSSAPTISSAPNMFSHILLIQQIPV